MEVFVGFVRKGLIGALVAMQRSRIQSQMGLKTRIEREVNAWVFEYTRIEGHSPVAPNTSICSDIITPAKERIKLLDLHENRRDKTGMLVNGRVYWEPVDNHTIYWVLRRS